ncbi:MAG TPA: phosphoglucosamine mutase [Alphaproteobacteria bacterium]|nr:phosphoglucosamine mutase [Alphaproteobacteria bacterium]
MKREKLFGTDGVRGKANEPPITADFMLKLAQVIANETKNGQGHRRVVIGKDTRLSGYMLESAITAGFVSAGVDVMLVGPIPTPAIAFLTRSLRADLGVMISASHNPFDDNGIKIFAADGFKLNDDLEKRIEQRLAQNNIHLASPLEFGRVKRIEGATERYIEFIKASLPRGMRLDGMKIVVDCANGAAYKTAPAVLQELGAQVITLATTPNGLNINQDCGALFPSNLMKHVLENQADFGFALDGDADRVVICDENGQIWDGDQVLAAIIAGWQPSGRIHGATVIGTIMSNFGFEEFVHSKGLKFDRTAVGDRYIVEAMQKTKCNIGGEQSGHIILSDFSTTGDGTIAAMQVLAVLWQQKKTASQLSGLYKPYPQKMTNIPYRNKQTLEQPLVQQEIAKVQAKLGRKGRLVIRKSGTEPVIRVMIEVEDQRLGDQLIKGLQQTIMKHAHD